MSFHVSDLYLLAPELTLVLLALAVMAVDLFVKRRIIVASVALIGLLVPAGFAIAQALTVTGTQRAFFGMRAHFNRPEKPAALPTGGVLDARPLHVVREDDPRSVEMKPPVSHGSVPQRCLGRSPDDLPRDLGLLDQSVAGGTEG